MSRITGILASAALAVALPSAASAAVVIDFDLESDYTSNFSEVFPTADSLSWSATAGVNGGGGVAGSAAANVDTTAVYNTSLQSLFGGPLSSFSQSIMVEIGAQPATASSFSIAGMLGISESTSTGFYSSGGSDFAAIRVRNKSGNNATPWSLQAQVGNNGAATQPAETAAFALTTGNWYKLTIVWARSGNDFGFNADLQDFGIDGLTPGSVIVSDFSGILTNATLAADPDVFPAFRGSRGINLGGYASGFDNFEVVPEPGTAVLALVSGALLLRRRRTT